MNDCGRWSENSQNRFSPCPHICLAKCERALNPLWQGVKKLSRFTVDAWSRSLKTSANLYLRKISPMNIQKCISHLNATVNLQPPVALSNVNYCHHFFIQVNTGWLEAKVSITKHNRKLTFTFLQWLNNIKSWNKHTFR